MVHRGEAKMWRGFAIGSGERAIVSGMYVSNELAQLSVVDKCILCLFFSFLLSNTCGW